MVSQQSLGQIQTQLFQGQQRMMRGRGAKRERELGEKSRRYEVPRSGYCAMSDGLTPTHELVDWADWGFKEPKAQKRRRDCGWVGGAGYSYWGWMARRPYRYGVQSTRPLLVLSLVRVAIGRVAIYRADGGARRSLPTRGGRNEATVRIGAEY